MIGWRTFGRVKPNRAHDALACLEIQSKSELLLTQNVDCLHQAARSIRVIDLPGRLDVVRCIGCGRECSRAELQEQLIALNPGGSDFDAADAPDGDADLHGPDFASFVVPPCRSCGGVLKPDVVFFGENVPKGRVDAAFEALGRADRMLIVGSSLMVYSGFRFVQVAAWVGKEMAAVNLGGTRADDLLTLKVEQPWGEALAFLR